MNMLLRKQSQPHYRTHPRDAKHFNENKWKTLTPWPNDPAFVTQVQSRAQSAAKHAAKAPVHKDNSMIVTCMSFDASGSFLAVGSLYGSIGIWDFRTFFVLVRVLVIPSTPASGYISFPGFVTAPSVPARRQIVLPSVSAFAWCGSGCARAGTPENLKIFAAYRARGHSVLVLWDVSSGTKIRKVETRAGLVCGVTPHPFFEHIVVLNVVGRDLPFVLDWRDTTDVEAISFPSSNHHDQPACKAAAAPAETAVGTSAKGASSQNSAESTLSASTQGLRTFVMSRRCHSSNPDSAVFFIVHQEGAMCRYRLLVQSESGRRRIQFKLEGTQHAAHNPANPSVRRKCKVLDVSLWEPNERQRTHEATLLMTTQGKEGIILFSAEDLRLLRRFQDTVMGIGFTTACLAHGAPLVMAFPCAKSAPGEALKKIYVWDQQAVGELNFILAPSSCGLFKGIWHPRLPLLVVLDCFGKVYLLEHQFRSEWAGTMFHARYEVVTENSVYAETEDEFDKNPKPAVTQDHSESPVDITLHAGQQSFPHLPARAIDQLSGDQSDGLSPTKRSRSDPLEANEQLIKEMIREMQQNRQARQRKYARSERRKPDKHTVSVSRDAGLPMRTPQNVVVSSMRGDSSLELGSLKQSENERA